MQSANVALFWDIKSKLNSWSSVGSWRHSLPGSDMAMFQPIVDPGALAQRTFRRIFRDLARPLTLNF
jgi:hypothetical protein